MWKGTKCAKARFPLLKLRKVKEIDIDVALIKRLYINASVSPVFRPCSEKRAKKKLQFH